eukprot:2432-Heterococcus_DN1.PRE.1
MTRLPRAMQAFAKQRAPAGPSVSVGGVCCMLQGKPVMMATMRPLPISACAAPSRSPAVALQKERMPLEAASFCTHASRADIRCFTDVRLAWRSRIAAHAEPAASTSPAATTGKPLLLLLRCIAAAAAAAAATGCSHTCAERTFTKVM